MNIDYVNSLLNVVKKSGIKYHHIDERTIRYSNDGLCEVFMAFSDVLSDKAKFDFWMSRNILLFTAFDGYLEYKYALPEEGSFRNHCNSLPSNNEIEIIQRDAYRIMKLIRNAIQHNSSSISQNPDNSWSISYSFNNTVYSLDISADSLKFLYSIIIAIIDNGIDCTYTVGHYEEILKTYYQKMISNVLLSDDIQDAFPANITGEFKIYVRYPISNPIQIYTNDASKIMFKYYDVHYYEGYAGDYSCCSAGKQYMLPEELGQVDKNKQYVTFDKSLLTDRWRYNG